MPTSGDTRVYSQYVRFVEEWIFDYASIFFMLEGGLMQKFYAIQRCLTKGTLPPT